MYRRARGDMIEVFKIVIATMIRNVYHTYSQTWTVIPEAITESCSSYNLIWICGKTLLQSKLCLNGTRCLLTLWTHRVLMPSRIVLISSGSIKKFASTIKPSSTIEPPSVAMFESGYTGCMTFVQYLFAFAFFMRTSVIKSRGRPVNSAAQVAFDNLCDYLETSCGDIVYMKILYTMFFSYMISWLH